jgi:putrescine transport system substrate-binding protein
MNFYKKISATLLVIAFSSAIFATSSQAAEEKVLNVYNWVDYIGADTIANFEKETGIKVNYQIYEDNETLDEALRRKKAAYDVVVPSSDWAKAQIDNGLLLKLDKSKIPNYKNLDANFLEKFKKTDPSGAYLAGYLWGYTTLGVNVDRVIKALGKTPLPKNLWELVFNPVYTKKLKSCGITMLDSSTDIMPIALHYIGKPPYSNIAADYAAAADMLKKVRPDVKEFASSGQAEKFADGSTCVAIGWGGDFYRARKMSKDKGTNLNIVPVFPEKGGLLFLDSMAIPANAKHPDNAHKFINYILRPEVHAKITMDIKFASPNKASMKFMDIAMANDRSLHLVGSDFNRLIAPEALEDSLKGAREAAFENFKAGK